MTTNVYTPPAANVDDVHHGGGAITEGMLTALRGTKGWVLLFGILLFLGAAFMLVGGFGMIAGMGIIGAAGGKDGPPAAFFAAFGVVYLIFAVIYGFLAYYLVQYSVSIGTLLRNVRTQDLETALNHQRKFWKLAGIMALIGIVFMVLGIIAAIAIPALMLGLK
jgi:hypothetical protein